MAAALGLNEKKPRRMAPLHDIGEALTHEVEGSDALIGGELGRKIGTDMTYAGQIQVSGKRARPIWRVGPATRCASRSGPWHRSGFFARNPHPRTDQIGMR